MRIRQARAEALHRRIPIHFKKRVKKQWSEPDMGFRGTSSCVLVLSMPS